MRKDEAVHLHALLRELRRYLESRGWVDAEAFAAYDELGISPLQVHRSKSEHIEALVVLADALADELAARSKYATEEELPPELAALRANGDS